MSDIRRFLEEDIGYGDITTDALIGLGNADAKLFCKQPCVLAGCEEAKEVFETLGLSTKMEKHDGEELKKGDTVLLVHGPASKILSGERLALNFLMRMSGIATFTHRMNEIIKSSSKGKSHAKVASTRKTTPGFRYYEKKAVIIGGGDPHRNRLDDMILIKENHVAVVGSIEKALELAKKVSFSKKIEIEVSSMKDALRAVKGGADIIMLDNMSPNDAKDAYDAIKKKESRVVVEVSGGINEDTIGNYANAADIISMGALTHSAKAIDFSLDITSTNRAMG